MAGNAPQTHADAKNPAPRHIDRIAGFSLSGRDYSVFRGTKNPRSASVCLRHRVVLSAERGLMDIACYCQASLYLPDASSPSSQAEILA